MTRDCERKQKLKIVVGYCERRRWKEALEGYGVTIRWQEPVEGDAVARKGDREQCRRSGRIR